MIGWLKEVLILKKLKGVIKKGFNKKKKKKWW